MVNRCHWVREKAREIMVESSKILTVSYGTFSCTLEGFDDSFSTMKAIAEYFRGLAERDRYFGAEPPTPDAEMLTRIAEREIERRVDARVDDNGIVLRASEPSENTSVRAGAAVAAPLAAGLTETTESVPAPAMPPQSTPPTSFSPSSEFDEAEIESGPSASNVTSFSSYSEDFDDDGGPTFEDMAAPLDAGSSDIDVDSVAAKLQRIRAVVGTGNEKDATSERRDGNQAFLARSEKSEFEDDMLEADARAEAAQAKAEEEAAAKAKAAAEAKEAQEAAAAAEAEAKEAEEAAAKAEADAAEEARVQAEAEAEAEAAQAAAEKAETAAKEAEEAAAKAEADAAEEARVQAESEAEAEAAKEAAEKAAADAKEAEEAAAKAEADAAEEARVQAEAEAEAEAAKEAGEKAAADAKEAEEAAAKAEADEEALALAYTEAMAEDAERTAAKAEAEDAKAEEVVEEVAADASETDATLGAVPTPEPVEKPSIRARILRVARPLRPTPVEVATEEEPAEVDMTAQAADEEPTAQSGDEDSLIARVRGARRSEETEDEASQDEPSEVAEKGMIASLMNGAAKQSDDADASADNVGGLEFSEEDANPTDGPMLLTDAIDPNILDEEASASLSDEDEADLQEELAEVEREIEEVKSTNRAGRDILPENDDAAMSRILNQTDEELAQPENSRRRNAIAQLKAAVAATEAARQLGDKSNVAAKTEDAFRDDLDDVVRPRRASSLPKAEVRTERPRPAPLKLVAAQRIDAPEDVPLEPVQPRRVASGTSDTNAGNFAEFAAEMGATELEDLLEAAAAYTAFVEGSEDFSRPQIMQKVQATSETGYSREDSLRSFGTLLREGRINKVRNGRFQISDKSRFNPERKAG